jgi:hypothetical protein
MKIKCKITVIDESNVCRFLKNKDYLLVETTRKEGFVGFTHDELGMKHWLRKKIIDDCFEEVKTKNSDKLKRK